MLIGLGIAFVIGGLYCLFMKNQMRQGTVRYLAKIVDMERKPSLAENSLSKLVVYPIAEYYDGEMLIIARHYISISLRNVKCNVGDELFIYVNPNMKEGFYLPEEINKHDFEAKVFFAIAAVLIVVGIIMQLA